MMEDQPEVLAVNSVPLIALAIDSEDSQTSTVEEELANAETFPVGLCRLNRWRELLADFATGPQTRLIAIKVMRVPGNPLIKGTFWLDDVKLTLSQNRCGRSLGIASLCPCRGGIRV